MSWRTKALLLAGAGALARRACRRSARTARPNRCCRRASATRRTCRRPRRRRRRQRPRPQRRPRRPRPATRPRPARPAMRWATSRRSSSTSRRCRGRPIISRFPRARPARPTSSGRWQPGNFGLGEDAFGGRNGPLYAALDAAARRAACRRAGPRSCCAAPCSRGSPAPAGVQPVDWVAERAALLLRMGEADAARMLVQAVDVEQYTPRMVEVAAQTALATADPAALCPLVGPARGWSHDPVWILADGMCAALEGEAARATALIDQARDQAGTSIDLLLAEKVVGAGAETRRAVDIQWDGVDEINPWRFGLASAVGLADPRPADERAPARRSAPGSPARRWCRSSSASTPPRPRRRSASSPRTRWSSSTA